MNEFERVRHAFCFMFGVGKNFVYLFKKIVIFQI